MATITNHNHYSIGQVATMFGLSIPTIRYYDSQGLIPNLQRNKSGNRLFNQDNLTTINLIECLKKTGMSIKDIKQFIQWCQQGDKTIEQRQQMFHQRKKILNQKLEELQSTMEVVDFKCHYYDIAAEHHSEQSAKDALAGKQPDGLKLKFEQ